MIRKKSDRVIRIDRWVDRCCLLLLGMCAIMMTTITPVVAQSTAGSAKVCVGLDLTPGGAMLFGAFSAGPNGGTIELDPQTGDLKEDGTVTLAGGITPQPGSFGIKGTDGCQVYVTFPGATALKGPSPLETHSMTLDSYTKYATNNPPNTLYPVLVGGEITIRVGGTLTVPNTVTGHEGLYVGTFDVIVGYY